MSAGRISVPFLILVKLVLDKLTAYRKNTIMAMKQQTKTYEEYNLTTDEIRLMKMMKALGHPARMQIVSYLRENSLCFTGDMVDLLPLAQATVSQHLKVLKDAGLLCGTIEGPATSYCLDDDGIAWLKERVNTLF